VGFHEVEDLKSIDGDGDLKVTKHKSTLECWMKSPTDVLKRAQDTIKTELTVPKHNYGKDNYCITSLT
jgi:hypothetical protein